MRCFSGRFSLTASITRVGARHRLRQRGVGGHPLRRRGAGGARCQAELRQGLRATAQVVQALLQGRCGGIGDRHPAARHRELQGDAVAHQTRADYRHPLYGCASRRAAHVTSPAPLSASLDAIHSPFFVSWCVGALHLQYAREDRESWN